MNGKSLGIVWHAPYRMDVTSALKPGANQVTIKVINAWVNRLIGDQQPDATTKYTFADVKALQGEFAVASFRSPGAGEAGASHHAVRTSGADEVLDDRWVKHSSRLRASRVALYFFEPDGLQLHPTQFMED